MKTVPDECFDPTGSVLCFRCDPPDGVLVPATRDFEDVQAVYRQHAIDRHSDRVALGMLGSDGMLHAWIED